jgi:hypothetical protein
MWDPVLFLPHHQMNFCICHLSTDRWARDVRNCVNSLLDYHLRELQKITPGVVDLRSENVKWYHFVNFASNVVVLCYSLVQKTENENPYRICIFLPCPEFSI